MSKEEIITYRGKEITIMGNGYCYFGMLWPKLAMVHQAIDNELDGTKKDILGQAYPFEEKEPPKINYQ
jgi:hypothetical protein